MGKGDRKDTVERSYEEFQPLTDWVREEGHDTIFVNLPGFKKEQLSIEIDEFRKMKISGERPIDGKNWIRFSHEFTLPDYCNLSKTLTIEFKNGILSIVVPKMTTQTGGQGQPMPIKESMLDKISGTPIDRQDQPMPKAEPPIDTQDQPMLKNGSPIDKQDQTMLKTGPPIERKDQPSFPVGLNWLKKVNVNVVVVTMVGMALGICAAYYVKSQWKIGE